MASPVAPSKSPQRSAPHTTWKEASDAQAPPYSAEDWNACHALALELQLHCVQAARGLHTMGQLCYLMREWMTKACGYARLVSSDITLATTHSGDPCVVWKCANSTFTLIISTVGFDARFSKVTDGNRTNFPLDGQKCQHFQATMNVELLIDTLADLRVAESTTLCQS